MQPSSARDTISIPDSNTPELNIKSETEEDIQPNRKESAGALRKRLKKKSWKHLKVARICWHNLDLRQQRKPQSITSPFALYVDEKLKLLDKRTPMFTEKRIMDSIFEAEMGALSNTPVRHVYSLC